MERREFLGTGIKMGIGTLAFSTAGFETACAVPTWVNTVEGIAGTAVDIAGTIVELLDPPLAALVKLVVAGFNGVLTAVEAYQKALEANGSTTTLLQAIQIAFTVLQAQAANLIAAFNLSSFAGDSTIMAIINLILEAVANIGGLLPAALTKAVRVQLSYKVFPASNGWVKQDFINQYNTVIGQDHRFKAMATTA